jgi:hypothetical protein
VTLPIRGARVMRTFGIGLTIQALLSGANFAVGLILIRRTNDLQYSYYVLATNALLLLTSLQASFIQPYIVMSITRMGLDGRREMVGGLIRTSGRWVPALCAAAITLTAGAWGLGWLGMEQACVVGLSLLAASGALRREFFRLTLFAYRRPLEVLRADLTYVALLIGGAFVATLTAWPAPSAIATLTLAALVGRVILSQGLWRYEPWNPRSEENALRKMVVHGGWAITGAGIHWLLIQGYSYLVASVLDIRYVAAIAATRLTLMPVFVLSGGVSMLLFPITSRWVHDLGATTAARRLTLLVTVLAFVAICYMASMWFLRDWIFQVILKKQFEQRDLLLLLWSAVFLVTLCRDQLATLPAACEKFRDMTLLTGASAAVWLVSSYWAMQQFGPAGAVAGILIGESVNMAGLIVMILRETRQPGVASAQ